MQSQNPFIDILGIKYLIPIDMSVLLPANQRRHLTQVWTLEKPHLPQPRVTWKLAAPPHPIPGSPDPDSEFSAHSSGSIRTQGHSVTPCQDLCRARNEQMCRP